MTHQSINQPLSNLQLELLKLYAQKVSDTDLIVIKRLIARYFAEKAMDAADKVWEEKGWNNAKVEELLGTKNELAMKSKSDQAT